MVSLVGLGASLAISSIQPVDPAPTRFANVTYQAAWRVEPIDVGPAPVWVRRWGRWDIARVYPSELVAISRPLSFRGSQPAMAISVRQNDILPTTPLVRTDSDNTIYCSMFSNIIVETTIGRNGYSACFMDRDRDGDFESTFFHQNYLGIFTGNFSGQVGLNPIEPVSYAASEVLGDVYSRLGPLKIALAYDGCWGRLDAARCEGITAILHGFEQSAVIGAGPFAYTYQGNLNAETFTRAGIEFRLAGDRLRLSRMQFQIVRNITPGIYHLREESD